MKNSVLGSIIILCIVACLLVFSPFISIWAVNTLFNAGIPYKFSTWLAALWINGLIAGSSGIKSK